MSRESNSLTDDDLHVSLETLNQWEAELDQFAAGVMRRLAGLSASVAETSGQVPSMQNGLVKDRELVEADVDPETLQLLKSLRELTQ